jgi:DNA helicase-2/ATP-dependent DNA helicase PcrA
LYEARDERVEAAYVVDTIKRMAAERQRSLGDFSVMYRTNAQSRLLEEAFLTAKLPYKLVGAQRFYGRREVKDVIAYLRLVHNINDEISIARVINAPKRGIGTKTFIALRKQAQNLKISMGTLLLQIWNEPEKVHESTIKGKTLTLLGNFGGLVAGWLDIKDTVSPLALMERIIEDVDYQSYIDDGSSEGRDRWENVLELRRLAAEFQDQGAEAFLEHVALVSDQDTLDGAASVPTLLTLHAAKGLEFPIVFITGLNDGTLPHSRSLDDPEELQEERRLLYVGITRAKDHLFLTYSRERFSYSKTDQVMPSRFLDDIPINLLDEEKPISSNSRSGLRAENRPGHWYMQSRASVARPAPALPRYQAGMCVKHSTWGEGIVQKVIMLNGDQVVEVQFDEAVGLKRIIASLTHLEIKV